jgi:hypothetical protein
MLKQQTRQAGQFGEWQQFNISMAANATEIPHLEATRQIFAGVLARIEEVFAQQAATTASKQDLSKQLQNLLAEGQRLSTVLKKAVAAHYGPRAEKLTEFRLQPFRGRNRKVKPEEPELPEAPKLPAPTAF